MYWTLELASYLEDAPWPATKDELIDFAMRTGAPLEVVENLQQIEDDEEVFDTRTSINSLVYTPIANVPKSGRFFLETRHGVRGMHPRAVHIRIKIQMQFPIGRSIYRCAIPWFRR
jgi:hypothetical protein